MDLDMDGTLRPKVHHHHIFIEILPFLNSHHTRIEISHNDKSLPIHLSHRSDFGRSVDSKWNVMVVFESPTQNGAWTMPIQIDCRGLQCKPYDQIDSIRIEEYTIRAHGNDCGIHMSLSFLRGKVVAARPPRLLCRNVSHLYLCHRPQNSTHTSNLASVHSKVCEIEVG
jgi:hypothetical protein